MNLMFPTKTIIGAQALDQLVQEVQKWNGQQILLITDPTLVKLGIVRSIQQPLEQGGFSITTYDDITPEPSVDTAERLLTFAKQQAFDLIIGFGGGSALDLAKLIAVLSANDGCVSDYLHLTGTKTVVHKGLPKILIPTTAGTGSEVTNIAVLSLATTKDVVAHDLLLADVAIIDPHVTYTVPANVTAATGMDALTHAIEAYLSVNASPVTDAFSLHAVSLLSAALKRAVDNGEDAQARNDLSHGSYLAGLAFFHAGVAGVHALAYPLGGQFHLAHGESNAVLLPYVMDYLRPHCMEKMKHLYKAMNEKVEDLSAEEASRRFVDRLHELIKEVHIPATLQDFHIPEDAIASLTQQGAKQTRLLARSPVPLTVEAIESIYTTAYKGVPVSK
ncbi:iron-containing alcohol dehydrogenase [Fictibacillus macauensis ZFHKF-1]|uniref:Iron-containing alcohol dehydrogenase n=1 Tax=Fictibacillus macauensis ZFHKF-1 TaxID=1196324 RepID=I8UGY5_9BACL|nr:iron-containing alcohol dehydrogenase [Fictibacillus macauensis]EIT86068.1 iron-containing alcohol dehydrogenase [Fictibacillus macauensis ZFHKF-1]